MILHRKKIYLFFVCSMASLVLSYWVAQRDLRAESNSKNENRLIQAIEKAGFKVRSFKSHEPQVMRSHYPFTSLEFNDPYLMELREQYHLAALVDEAEDEWTAQLILKDWVNRRIPGGNPTSSPRNALEILERASTGERFYCTYYAITYVECAQALGWQARKIGVDRKHQGGYTLGSSHHGAAEVWSNQFCKWILIDAQSNLHFEKSGIPLSAWEIREEWLGDQGKKVAHVVGAPPHSFHQNPAMVWSVPDADEIATYFWLYVQDSAVGNSQDSKFLLWEDEHNAHEIWFQNDGELGHSQFHSAYLKNRFVPTARIEDLYWTVGIVEPEVYEVQPKKIHLRLSSYCPNLAEYQLTHDGSTWKATERELVWILEPGWNTLGLRTMNLAGATGPETAFVVLLALQK